MLNFLLPKTKVQAYDIKEVPIENFEVIGISQINPYCNIKYENETFLTVVNLANNFKSCDEKEGMLLSRYFTVRRCPRCRKVELIPTKIRLNFSPRYLKNPEDYALDFSYESKYNFPSCISAYCSHCASCFEIHIKHSDLWVKEAKRVRERDLIGCAWEEYQVE